MSNVLLDTNILIYSIDEESKYFEKSQNIIQNTELELYTTSKNLSEFLSVITKIPNSLSVDEALIIIQDFANISNILYPSQRSFEIFADLLHNYKPTGYRIHDFEIISIGFSHKINTIATFDEKDFSDVKEVKLYPL